MRIIKTTLKGAVGILALFLFLSCGSDGSGGGSVFIQSTATLSGKIFRDIDSDGIRLSIENGPLVGVEIFLENTSGTSVFNAFTDSSGVFTFEDIPLLDAFDGEFQYTLRVNELSLPFNSTVTNGNPIELSLIDGDLMEHDFTVGYRFENNSHIIVTFGDSITWGVGDENSDTSCINDPGGYPERLAVRLKAVISDISIRNEAVCGSQGATSAVTFVNGIRRHNPGYALIMYGANDVLSFSPEETVETLLSMILFSRQEGIFPILGLSPITPVGIARSERILELNIQITEMANQLGVPVADVFSRFGTDVGLFIEDGVHPTSAGYDIMQDVWYDTLINQPISHEFTFESPIIFTNSTETSTMDPTPEERMYPWSAPLDLS